MEVTMKWLLWVLVCCFSWMQASETEFVVGTAGGYAPFVSIAPDGKYEGFDIDLANMLAKKLNKKLVLKDLGSMPSLLLALQQKKVDAVIWAVSITQERQQHIEMVHYQGADTLALPLLFWGKIPETIHSMEDMVKEKKVVSVEAGSSQDDFLRTIPNLQIKYVDKVTDAIMELKYGKISATLIDPSLVHGFLEKHKELKVLRIPLPPESQVHGIGICLNKSEEDLIMKVRQAVNELKSNQEIAQLEKKWNIID